MDRYKNKLNEKSRVRSFERTGCLLTLTPDEEEDKKIKPQGLSLPYKVPARENAIVVDTNDPSEKPKEIVGAETIENEDSEIVDTQGDDNMVVETDDPVDLAVEQVFVVMERAYVDEDSDGKEE